MILSSRLFRSRGAWVGSMQWLPTTYFVHSLFKLCISLHRRCIATSDRAKYISSSGKATRLFSRCIKIKSRPGYRLFRVLYGDSHSTSKQMPGCFETGHGRLLPSPRRMHGYEVTKAASLETLCSITFIWGFIYWIARPNTVTKMTEHEEKLARL
jgi:hypothetical protein